MTGKSQYEKAGVWQVYLIHKGWNCLSAVLNFLGTGDWFHGRQFFHKLRDSFRMIQAHHTYCVVIVVQLLSCVWHFATPACQASLSFTISLSLLRLMSIESVMPSNHLILCHPLLLPPSIFPSIRVFSTLFLLLLHQFHLRFSGIRSQNLGTPALHHSDKEESEKWQK